MTRVNGALIDIPDDEVDTLLNHERELERGALHRRHSRRRQFIDQSARPQNFACQG